MRYVVFMSAIYIANHMGAALHHFPLPVIVGIASFALVMDVLDIRARQRQCALNP